MNERSTSTIQWVAIQVTVNNNKTVQSTSTAQYSKGYECFVDILAHVLYALIFLVLGFSVPTSCMCTQTAVKLSSHDMLPRPDPPKGKELTEAVIHQEPVDENLQ